MPHRRYLADPDVVCRQEPDCAILFNPETNRSQGVNAVGHLIWQALAEPRTPAEIVAHLVETCQDVPVEQAGDDVEAFLQNLRSGSFVGQVLDGDEPFPGTAPASPGPPLESDLAHQTDDEDHASYYHGSSMLGTFRPGDRLLAEIVPLTAVRPGDVVIYRGQEKEGKPERIVHRVVAVTAGGLVTRGDNNRQVDKGLVTQDVLVGRVTHRERGGRVRPVWAGCWGVLQLWARRAWRRVRRLGWQLLRLVGAWLYRWLRTSGLAGRLWRPTITRLLVTTGNGPLVKYVHRQRTVARWRPATGRFSCRRPYDLIILRPDGKVAAHDRTTEQS
jgi:signal peptidase I